MNLGATVQSMAIILAYIVAIVFVHHDPVSTPTSFCGDHSDGLAVTRSEARLPLATVAGPGRPAAQAEPSLATDRCADWLVIHFQPMQILAGFFWKGPWEPFPSVPAELASCCSKSPGAAGEGALRTGAGGQRTPLSFQALAASPNSSVFPEPQLRDTMRSHFCLIWFSPTAADIIMGPE